MYTAILAFFEEISALKWVGLVVAVLGMALLFTDLVMNIKKHSHTKMNIVAMVFLCLSLVCYILTQWVFVDKLPSIVGFVWVVFLVAYFVCDVIMAVGIGRDNHRKKVGMGEEEEDTAAEENAAETQENNDAPSASEGAAGAVEASEKMEFAATEQTADEKPARKRGRNKKGDKAASNDDGVEAVNMLEAQDSDGKNDPTE